MAYIPPPAAPAAATAYTDLTGTPLQYGHMPPVASSVETMPRWAVSGTNGMSNGNLHLQLFTPDASFTTSSHTFGVGTAAAGATLMKAGLYSANADGTFTLLTSWSDTATANVASGVFTKAWATPTALTRGARYAVGWLNVGTTTQPTLKGTAGSTSALNALSPAMAQVVTGQTDLPASIAAGAPASASVNYYRLT